MVAMIERSVFLVALPITVAGLVNAPVASESSALNVVVALKDPAVVKATVTVPPGQTLAGVIEFVVIVWPIVWLVKPRRHRQKRR
jgi:hypothetical protein